jgi:hypothetical protein
MTNAVQDRSRYPPDNAETLRAGDDCLDFESAPAPGEAPLALLFPQFALF